MTGDDAGPGSGVAPLARLGDAIRRERLLVATVLASAVYSFVVLVLPARGLTFVADDWQNLYRIATTPWPERWIGLNGFYEHWPPIMFTFLDAERMLFGLDHTFFVVTAWVVHVANVFLLARLLHVRTGERWAAALGAAAFGLTTHYRAVIWWATCGPWVLCLHLTLLGFLAHERYRRSGETRWLVAAALAVFAAPTCIGVGIALGPALVFDSLCLLEGYRRRAAVVAALAGWGAYFLCYAFMVGRQSTAFFPRDASEWLMASRFGLDVVGSGMVEQVLFRSVGTTDGTGPMTAIVYAVLVIALAWRLDRPGRLRLLGAHVYLLLLVGPIALTRWSFAGGALAFASRYQYLPAVAWTTTLSFGLVLALRSWPVAAKRLAWALPALLALGHARLARDDRSFYAPAVRREHPLIIERLKQAVRAAHGPVYNAQVPYPLAIKGVHVGHVLAIADPSDIIFTNLRTEETVAPYRSDPVLAAFFGPF